ncbi:MAG: hypothetical protein ACYS47_01505 [Planctomycetota bacterium]|jgi:hypothetical protein
MMFFHPSKPIATCTAKDCADCPVANVVHCHFRLRDLTHFLLVWVPGFVVGAAGLLAFGAGPLAVWIALILGFFCVVEIRVLCSHCPHYAEDSPTLSCWANHGVPKLWKYRPGPTSTVEKAVFLGGLALVWVFPPVFLVIGERWFLLALYVLTNAAFFATLKLSFCSRCMNFACPLNSVGEEARELFFQRNPAVAKHWGKPTQDEGGRPLPGKAPNAMSR